MGWRCVREGQGISSVCCCCHWPTWNRSVLFHQYEKLFFDALLCIGKRFWAYYVLRRRLGEKSASLWYQGSVLYLFCSEGVWLVPDTFSFNRFKPRIWTIIDSAYSTSGIPSILAHFPPGVFPVYITSPNPKRWSGMTQTWKSCRLIMNPWSRLGQGQRSSMREYVPFMPVTDSCWALSNTASTYIQVNR